MNQKHTKFIVVLHCTKTNQSNRKDIYFSGTPVSVSDIKEKIQNEFSIPVCVQVLSFEEGHSLKDIDKLLAWRIRNGDTFHVKYLAKSNYSDIDNIITWLKQLSNALASGSSDCQDIIQYGKQNLIFDNLFNYFSPWYDSSGVSYANKLHFIHSGGFSFLMEVYAAVLKTPWQEMSVNEKYIESCIPSILWSIVETIPLRRLVLQHGGIQMCTKSLLRVKLEKGKLIGDHELSNDHYQKALLVQTINGSVGILCNLADLPECRVAIVSNKDVLNQLTCLALEPTIATKHIAVFFYTLAFTQETHEYIANSTHIGRLLEDCEHFRSNEPETLLAGYFTYVFLAQVCLVSPHCIERGWYGHIKLRLLLFLHNTTVTTIRKQETEKNYEWLTVEPFVKLFYIPNIPQQPEGLIGQVQLLSLQLVLFVLENMFGRESQREVLLKEGLLDYVVCMPQYVPPLLRPQAEELVQMVVSSPDIPEGPPRLLNLVKARLAKMHFGLEQVLSLSVSEIVSKTLL